MDRTPSADRAPAYQPVLKNRMDGMYAARYRELWHSHWWWRARRAVIERAVRRLAVNSPLDNILDIGCGDGLFFHFLEQFGNVRGIESDSRIVSDPTWNQQIEITNFDESYSCEERFNLILMLDVLEHIEDDRGAVRKLFELLAPGGHVVLTVPAISSLWSQHDVVNGHFRRYLLKKLVDLLESEGLTVVKKRYLFSWAVLPMFVRRCLHPAQSTIEESGYGTEAIASGQGPLSRLALCLSRAEHKLGDYVSPPIGTSCMIVAQRPVSTEVRRTKPR